MFVPHVIIIVIVVPQEKYQHGQYSRSNGTLRRKDQAMGFIEWNENRK